MKIVKIATCNQFKTEIVEADFQEFMNDAGNLRKAWHCAGSLFHLHDWVYAANKTQVDAAYTFEDDNRRTQKVSCASHFANSLGQENHNFQLIRGIANASKHFELIKPPPGRHDPPAMPSAAANTYVITSEDASRTAVVLEATGSDILFSFVAKSVRNMWDTLFKAEGW